MEQLSEPRKEPRREPESIKRLRQITGTRTPVTPDTVESWLHALAHEPWRGPADIAANPPLTPAQRRAKARGKGPELVAVSEEQILNDLADLGHFVYVSSDEIADMEVAWADRFELSPDSDGIEVGDQVPLTGMGHLPKRVLVDAKFSRKHCGKDLLRAVLRAVSFALALREADEADKDNKHLSPKERAKRYVERRELLQRWVLRRHWGLRPQLTFPIVATVAVMAALERIEEIDEVAEMGGSPNPNTAAVLVEAWDFLVVGVDDAVRAVERICADADGEIDLESVELDRAVLRLRSLHEGIASRLERELHGARAAGDPRRWHSAAAEFARRVEADPARWNPEIAELNDAQILRLAGSGGLNTTEPDHRIESEVREWLHEFDLGSELATSLLWHGVNLHAAGHGEAFRAALARRRDGDLHWADDLNAIRVSSPQLVTSS